MYILYAAYGQTSIRLQQKGKETKLHGEYIRKETALCGKVSDFPSSTPQRAYLFPVLAVQTGHRVHVTKFFSPVNPKL